MLRLFKRPDSEVWQIHGTIGDRRVRQSAGTTDRAQAEETRAHLEARLRREAHYGRENETTFAEAALAYAETKKARGENACSQYIAHLVRMIGNRKLATFSSGEVQDLAVKLHPEGSASTRNRHGIAAFMAVYNHAVVRKLAPPMKVERFTEKPAATRSVDATWIEAVRGAMADRHARAMVRLMFDTGMRLGTVLALTPAMLDAERCIMQVPGALLKSGEDHEFILPADLARELAALPSVAEVNKAKQGPGQRRNEALLFGFTVATGFYKLLRKACAKADVDYVPPHQSGRHSFATTYLVDHEVDPVTVAQLGGWQDVPHMIKRYPHAREAKLRAVVERVAGGAGEGPKLRAVK